MCKNVLVVAVGFLLITCINEASAAEKGRSSGTSAGFVDVHMHLDGVQNPASSGPPGLPPAVRRKMVMRRQAMMSKKHEQADGTASADYLISLMDQHGVEKAIVMPPPQKSGQHAGYTYTSLLDSIRKYPDRLVLGGGGGTLNPMILDTKPSEVTEDARAIFRAKAEEIAKAGAHVFGEMAALHICMNPKHSYSAALPDHPLYLLLADIAAEQDIPIDLHMEAVSSNMATPADFLEACDQNPNTLQATIPAFERLLEHNRGARIVWQHIGWDNTGQMTPSLLGALLEKHPNLYLAIKAVPESGRVNRIHDDHYRVLPEWLRLFEAFSDRVVVGADEFARSESVKGGYKKPPFFSLTWKVIMSLPSELRDKIGSQNAMRIYRLES